MNLRPSGWCRMTLEEELFVTLKFSLCSAFLFFLSMTFTYLHGEALSCPE